MKSTSKRATVPGQFLRRVPAVLAPRSATSPWPGASSNQRCAQRCPTRRWWADLVSESIRPRDIVCCVSRCAASVASRQAPGFAPGVVWLEEVAERTNQPLEATLVKGTCDPALPTAELAPVRCCWLTICAKRKPGFSRCIESSRRMRWVVGQPGGRRHAHPAAFGILMVSGYESVGRRNDVLYRPGITRRPRRQRRWSAVIRCQTPR